MLDNGVDSADGENEDVGRTNPASKTHASKSNIMRRVLGLDGGGLLTVVQRTRTLSNFSSAFRTTPTGQLPGLGNWDNSCYQNSVLQGLAALESFPRFLEQITESKVSQPTSNTLKGLIDRLNNPENEGKTFWTPAELKNMSSWQQQDAQEYFSKISGEIEKDVAMHMKAKTVQSRLDEMKTIKHESAVPSAQSADVAPGGETVLRTQVHRLPQEVASLILRNPFEGLLAQRVGCQRCGYVEGLSIVPFNCLTVPLGRQWMYDVRACLDDYTALEPISGVECDRCTLLQAKHHMERLLPSLSSPSHDKGTSSTESLDPLLESIRERLETVNQILDNEDFSDQALKKCKIPAENRILTTKTRQAVIARSPQSLVIHVNRSNFDERTGVQSKNLANVVFPKQLDLGPWCLGRTSQLSDGGEGTEHWDSNPMHSMLSEDVDREGVKYELRAVVTHYGRHENGHYICYRRSPYPPKSDDTASDGTMASWWRLSDEDVSEVDEDIVLAQGGVFMLFYEFIDRPTPPAREQHAISIGNETAATMTSEGNVESPAISIETLPSDQHDPPAAILPDQHPSAEAALPTPPQTPPGVDEDINPISSSEATTVLETAITPPCTETDTLSPTTQPLEPPAASSKAPSSPPRPPSPVTSMLTEQKQPAVTQAKEPSSSAMSKENQPVSPASMRTAAPRSGRGRGSRAGKAMESVAGFVQAN